MTPASGRFLLDTNIVIALFDGDPAVVVNLDHAAEILIPAVVMVNCSLEQPNQVALPRTSRESSDSLPVESSCRVICVSLAITAS